MRIKFIAGFLLLFLLISTAFANEHYISDVTGLTPEGTIPIDGSTVTFTIGLNNTGPDNITGNTNGWRIYSPSGAEWTATVPDTGDIGILSTMYDTQEQIVLIDVDGIGEDTVGFGGFRIFAPGIPIVDIPDAYTITIGPVDASYDGGEICIDSSFYPPAGAWAWATTGGEIYPGWAGPFCYTIGIATENEPPILAPIGDKVTDETVNLNFTIFATDADGDPLTYSMTSPDLPVEASFNPGTQTFDWTPNLTDAGVYSATFTVSDGTDIDEETITITVNDFNNPPVLDPIGDKTTDEGNNLNFTVTGSDPDGDPLTISILATDLPPGYTFNGSVFDWTPSYTDAGVYSVTFTVTDGTDSDEETITITVFNVNRAPVLDLVGDKTTDENVLLTFTASASDPDNDALIFDLINTDLPSGYSFIAGVFDWTPTFNDAGVYTATITVTDGLLSDEETITITVNDVNRAPVLNPIGNKVTNEEQLLQFNVFASDPDGDAVTILMVAPTLPPAATFDGAQFNWTPAVGDAGVYSVEFVATDGILEDTETIQITVNSSNQPPYFEDPIPGFVVPEGETIVWLLHAFDPNDDNLTMWLNPVLPNMSYSDLGEGVLEITFSPNCSQAGDYVLSAFVADGEFTVSVDINFSVTEACDPTESGIAIIEPDPVKVIYAFLIDPMDAVIYFGNLSGGLTIADVNIGSLTVNGLIPGAITVEPSHPLFDGEVLRIEVSMRDFVESYPALYDTTLQTFLLTGSFNDKCSPIDVHGEFTFIGKLRGDVNLDGSVDINDLTYIIDFFFHNGRPPIDIGTADMDGDGFVGITDLTLLINLLFHL